MSEKEIAIKNIASDLDELGARIAIAKFNMSRFRDNKDIARIAAQNVIYASQNLRQE